MFTITASLIRNPNNITGHVHAIDPYGSGSTFNQPVDLPTFLNAEASEIASLLAPIVLTFANLAVSPAPTPGYHGWRVVLDTESVVVVEFDFDTPIGD